MANEKDKQDRYDAIKFHLSLMKYAFAEPNHVPGYHDIPRYWITGIIRQNEHGLATVYDVVVVITWNDSKECFQLFPLCLLLTVPVEVLSFPFMEEVIFQQNDESPGMFSDYAKIKAHIDKQKLRGLLFAPN